MIIPIPNKTIEELVGKASKFIAEKAYKFGTERYDKFLVSFDLCFKSYLERSYKKYSQIKTILYTDKPVDIKHHYVQSNFRFNGLEIDGKKLFDFFVENKNNVIVGTAGSGKSVFMRNLFINIIENENSIYIPILVELRLLISYNQDNDSTIFDYIYDTVSNSNDNFSKEQLEYALKQGKIALLLDGFDEIDYEKKVIYEKEILKFSDKYSKSMIVVTSRPDERFSSWGEFCTYHVLPLNKSQAIDLISKIEYDIDVKEKFIGELNNGLFEKHKEFLSNPLLLTMMLLTYEQLAEIPEKIHIFYEQAFDTLYHKHDASKQVYKRKSYCSLPIDDFKRIFSAFCIITYFESKFAFSKDEILISIKKALSLESIDDIEPKNYFNDLLESVCVIQKDGDFYSFSHRSFQEYFSAYFISKSKAINVRDALNRISIHSLSDSVIRMLYELNKELVEKEWIVPELQKIIAETNDINIEENPIKYLSNFYDSFHIFDEIENDSEINSSNRSIAYGMSYSIPNGYFLQWAKRLNIDITKKFDSDYLISTDEENNADVMFFLQNTPIDEPSLLGRGLPFSYFDGKNETWIFKTTIPHFCFALKDFLKYLHKELMNKHSKKSSELANMLFLQ